MGPDCLRGVDVLAHKNVDQYLRGLARTRGHAPPSNSSRRNDPDGPEGDEVELQNVLEGYVPQKGSMFSLSVAIDEEERQTRQRPKSGIASVTAAKQARQRNGSNGTTASASEHTNGKSARNSSVSAV